MPPTPPAWRGQAAWAEAQPAQVAASAYFAMAELDRRSKSLAIIEDAVRTERPATTADILAEVRRLKLQTPAEAADLIRADRDGRPGR